MMDQREREVTKGVKVMISGSTCNLDVHLPTNQHLTRRWVPRWSKTFNHLYLPDSGIRIS